jgi:hypothetical protein
MLDLRLRRRASLLDQPLQGADFLLARLLDSTDRHVGIHVIVQRRLNPPFGLSLRLQLISVALTQSVQSRGRLSGPPCPLAFRDGAILRHAMPPFLTVAKRCRDPIPGSAAHTRSRLTDRPP